MESIATVTTGRCAWRMAAMAAVSSTSFMMMPPCTLPCPLECSGIISWFRVTSVSAGALARGSGGTFSGTTQTSSPGRGRPRGATKAEPATAEPAPWGRYLALGLHASVRRLVGASCRALQRFDPMDLLYFVILISSLIFVHELGHFLFAKAFGVKVLTFSLGFGPKILKLRGRETEYCISLLPPIGRAH